MLEIERETWFVSGWLTAGTTLSSREEKESGERRASARGRAMVGSPCSAQ